MQSLGVIIIGRNEGERLRRCLASIVENVPITVYVDSGSTDGSTVLALQMGANVVALNIKDTFSAAKGRNAGYARLIEIAPDTEYIFFIDGDCELIDEWLQAGKEFLEMHTNYALTCGRLRERYPERTIYNQLCDIEWNGEVGDIDACGGIFMIRAKAFSGIGGMNSSIIAGEEPEMCYRLRHEKWKISRIQQDMAWHDADITSFGQWWKRVVRSGHSYAHGLALHGKESERFCLRDSVRIWFWAFFLPVAIFTFTCIHVFFLLLVLLYPIQLIKISLEIRVKTIN